MLSLHKRFSCDIWERCCFDPATLLMGGSLAAQGVGLALQGAGTAQQSQAADEAAQATLAGGNAALLAGQLQKQAADFQAAQDEENAGQAFAAGQRQMLDTQERTRLALSTLRAGAAGNGTNAAVGSPAVLAGEIAQRGSYNAAMDMFNGASASTGLINKATGERFSGEAALIGGQEAQQASILQAKAAQLAGTASVLNSSGTIAGSVGNMFKTYGSFAFPSAFKAT